MREVQEHKIGMNKIFKGANETNCRYVVLKGSAGSGKSVNIARLLVQRLSDPKNEGMHALVVRKFNESHKDSTRAELVSAINCIFEEDAANHWHIPDGDLTLTCKDNGNTIIFRGMKDREQREKLKSISTKSGSIVFVWIEEATQLLPSEFNIIDDRLRGILPTGWHYQIFLTFNPVSSTHWIKSRFFDRQDSDVYISESTYKDNRFIDDDYSARMDKMKEIDYQHWLVYGAGEWGEVGGLIISRFKICKVDQDITHYDAVSIGQDFGYNHANAILLLGWKDGCVYVLREHYVHEKTTPEIIADVERTGLFADAKKAGVWLICDSAEPDRIAEWKKAGYKARPVDKGKNKATSSAIDWLQGLPCIYIDESAENTAAEISSWKWAEDRKTGQKTDEPEPINDDAMAALRYGTEPFRIASKRKPRRKVIT